MPVIQQLCVPKVLREKLMIAYHDDQCHIGQERLYNSLKTKYWFPMMYTSVLAYVRACEICQRTKSSQHKKRAPLKPLEVVEPFGRIHLDFIGPLPVTREKFKHLLVIVDSTTLWPEAFPTKTTTAEEVAQILFKEIICRYGAMRQILTDGGSSFRNKLIAELCKLLNIKHTISSPHHPQTDGKCERMNQTIIKSLRLVCDDQTEWSDKVAPVLMSYRASVAKPLGVSPYYALYARQMNLGVDVTMLTDFEKSPDIQAYTANLLPKLKLVHEAVQENLKDSNVITKTVYDRKTEVPLFEIGSKVWLHDPTTKKGECPKLKKRFQGPYLIVGRSDDKLSYKLRNCETGKEQRSMIHSNRLKACNENKEAFFAKNSIVLDQQPSAQSDEDMPSLDDGWFEINKVTSRKKIRGKDTFLVHWSDGSTSREPAENITEYAKAQYFIALERRKKHRKRNK